MDDEPKAATPKIRPRRLTLESNLKYFSLNSGVSSGSTVGMEWDVDEGTSEKELWERTWTEKKKLDVAALAMEYARGALSREEFENARTTLQQRYRQILGSKAEDEKS